jgi:2,3-bisphosphoglycerate-independent phosphoglycerate mutase
MHILLIFLDGIGLGEDDPSINPFAAINAPTLHALAGDQHWLRATARTETARAIFIPTDPRLGVMGRPQSATGQAAIMTGRNVPAEIGEHYGPKPTPAIRQIIGESSLYKRLTANGKRGALLDAYPPRLFQSIDGGKRLRSSIQESVYVGDVPIFGVDELYSGEALSADWTGQGWRDFLEYPDAPLLTPAGAGRRMAELARRYDFSLFSTWITDEIGHRGPLERGVEYLELFDSVMAGLLDAWDDDNGLIIITSDHGNLEDISIRQHTLNDVPTVLIGAARHTFAEGFAALTDITPKVLKVLGLEGS